MNPIKAKYFFLIVLLFSILTTSRGQSVYHLNFEGMLSDIEGQRISNDQFDLVVKLQYESDQEVLYEIRKTLSSDKEGWFGFSIEEISAYILNDANQTSPLEINLEFLPNSNTIWLDQDGDFTVSYTISAQQKEDLPELKITRMEGSELIPHTEEDIYVFKDQIPFAYLTGGFLISRQSPPDKQMLEDLKTWISPSEDQEAASGSRGVKGGFPTGGYHRTKK